MLLSMPKILEKFAIHQIMKYIEEEQILSNLQSAFRKNYSSYSALMFADFCEARDKGRCSTVVLLDYSQACDSINHTLLLVSGVILVSRIVQLKIIFTSWAAVNESGHDTSSGQLSGSLLFTLYTADLPNYIAYFVMLTFT